MVNIAAPIQWWQDVLRVISSCTMVFRNISIALNETCLCSNFIMSISNFLQFLHCCCIIYMVQCSNYVSISPSFNISTIKCY